MIGRRVAIINGPLVLDMFRRVREVTAERVVLAAAGNGPDLVYSKLDGAFVSGPDAFNRSSIDTCDFRQEKRR